MKIVNNLNYRLIVLPIIGIIAIVILSFLFSQKIQILKKEIDLIYFGNFVPIHKLHQIKEYLIKSIDNKKTTKKNKKIILNNWKYYNKQYKTKEERVVLNKINKQLLYSIKSKNKIKLRNTLKNILYLIDHEIFSAKAQRKRFLLEYKKMQNYLFYSQIIIIVFILILMAVIISQAISQNRSLTLLNEQYKIEANTDALTKLYNRKYFDSIFSDLIKISMYNKWESVFVMIDIDFFKQFNDTYGHDAGDIALQKVAYVLDRYCNKEHEYTFRIGGEEFGIIIFNTNKEYVKSTLDNIKLQISKLKIPHLASSTSFLTLSMGALMINKDNYQSSIKKLYTQADKKLYFSKENGRNQYTL